MDDLQRFVGRIGSLDNSGHTEFIVQSYNSITTEYEVKMLREPEARTKRVKLSDIKWVTRPDFLDTFPNPTCFFVQDKLDMMDFPSGSIVDFNECASDPIIVGCDQLSIMGSYRFVGKRTEIGGEVVMRTRLPYCVHIAAPNDSDIVEFENILFELDDTHSHNIVCLRGTIVFRNCVIKGAVNGLILGSENFPVKVTFEKGTICNKGGCGVIVDAKGRLVMIGVELEGTGVGWYVNNGVCVVRHSVISNRSFGLVMCGINSRASISHCAFKEQKYCGVFVYSGALFMYYSHVSHAAECGIVIWGNADQTNATLTACRVTNSRCGVRFSESIIFTCFRIFVSECVIGIYIPGTSIGQFQFYDHGYSTVHNTIDFVNFGKPYCKVTINDVTQPVENRLQRIKDVNDIMLRLPPNTSKELSMALNINWPIKVKRYLTRLDIQVKFEFDLHLTKVTCHACSQLEPVNAITPMKKCGRCKQVCYCSTACQEGDWPSHKIKCKMANNWQRELHRMGFFDCQQCHKVTSITDAAKGSDVQGAQRPRLCKGCGDVQQCVIT